MVVSVSTRSPVGSKPAWRSSRRIKRASSGQSSSTRTRSGRNIEIFSSLQKATSPEGFFRMWIKWMTSSKKMTVYVLDGAYA